MRFFAVLSLLFFLAGCSDRGTAFGAPAISDIRTINAQLYNRGDKGADLANFEVPKSDYESILDLLDGAREDRKPMKWQVLGDVEIVLTTGSTEVSLFWTNQEVGAFRVKDTYYRGGSDADFIKVISAAQRR